MTDLLQALPDFDVSRFSHILPSLDRHQVTLSDLLTLDAVDVAKRAHVPSAEIRRLTDAALGELRAQLGVSQHDAASEHSPQEKSKDVSVREDWEVISTLDQTLDAELGGGVPTRYLTEVVGESGAGKTQVLLSLLLAVQLPVELGGLAGAAVYISTEAALSTSRLAQVVEANPVLTSLPVERRPSLSKILTLQTPDLESQDHILRYQLPVAIKRYGIRLVVIDSIAANFRAEFERKGGRGPSRFDAQDNALERTADGQAMAARRAQLIQLGSLLRNLARTENVAIVVANQVADRFFGGHGPASTPYAGAAHRGEATFNSQPLDYISNSQIHSPSVSSTPRTHSAGSSTAPSATGPIPQPPYDPFTLDHQQRFFTGWGDLPIPPAQLKTPSLGLVWANQLACRIALTRDPGSGSGGWSQPAGMKGRRWMRVVFSAWCAPSRGKGVQFKIWQGGVRSVTDQEDDANEPAKSSGHLAPSKRLRSQSPCNEA